MGQNVILHGKDYYTKLSNDSGKSATSEVEILAGGLKSHSEFVPSAYTGKITTNGVGVTTAVAAGATKILFQSIDTTAAESANVAFGTSAANAIVNLTIVSARATSGVVIGSNTNVSGTPITLGIPADATHFALATGVIAATQVIMVTQGI